MQFLHQIRIWTTTSLQLLAFYVSACACRAQTQPVRGFADLHCHPASHLAFGAVGNGNNGLFWGLPADEDNLSALSAGDLSSCASLAGLITHNGGTADPVQIMTDWQMVSAIDGTVKAAWSHQTSGSASFSSWPSALSVDHQQMDITSIKRAYDGGLRLMFASVTDDEVISDLWNQKLNFLGNTMPTHNPNFDYLSAITQLNYIQALVSANSSFMQIVTSPSQARAAINNNKLAVVLSLEMDSLSLPQVLALVQNYNVRHVIPVHLVDNPNFGGTAVYNDKFNSENVFFNASPYATESDPNVSFQLASPTSQLTSITPSIIGSLLGGSATSAIFSALTGPLSCVQSILSIFSGNFSAICQTPQGAFGYIPWPLNPNPAQQGSPGVVNSMGLNKANFLALMQAQVAGQPCGLLLDIVHMGKKSADDALTLAEQYQYPLMDSHTGFRCDGVGAPNPVAGCNCATEYGSPPFGQPPSAYPPPGSSTQSTTPGVDERSLPVSQVLRIAKLGGVIGVGVVSAAEGGMPDPDPVGSWIRTYSMVWSLMGGRGVALGTDCNGLSPMIQGDIIWPNYPITVAVDYGGPTTCKPLPQFTLGQKTFNFQSDGIATYGLLPDFIQATTLPGRPSSPAPGPATMALFRTAEDTIEMWEKALAAEMNIPAGGSSQIASSCDVTAVGPLDKNTGKDTPVLEQPILFQCTVMDQSGTPMRFPVKVTYSGNVSFPPPKEITGIDQLPPFTPTVPGIYTLTASFSSVSDFHCTATVRIPPILNSVSSPLASDPTLLTTSFVPMANADGSTPLTLNGLGFGTVTNVLFGNDSVPVTPASDTTILVKAPRFSGSGPATQVVNVSVISPDGVKSGSISVHYFSADVPYLSADTSENCQLQKTFNVWAYVQDTNANLIKNASIKFSVGGVTQSVPTNPSDGVALFWGNFTNLTPTNIQSYLGTASYVPPATQQLPNPKANTAAFRLPQPPTPNPVNCGGVAGQLSARIPGKGALINTPICIACNLADVPSDFNDSQYYIDDLVIIGALPLVGNRLLPDLPVTQSGFVEALKTVLVPSLAALVATPTAAERNNQRPVTRGQASAMVAHFTAVQGAPVLNESPASAFVRVGYLRPINNDPAPELPLSRIEMVNLLWHVAQQQVSSHPRVTPAR